MNWKGEMGFGLWVFCAGVWVWRVAEVFEKVRVDKWLWSVRLFKTRTLAGEACRGGKVRISDERVKPSRVVKVGELVLVQQEDILREVKVVGLLKKRVGAKLVSEYMEDLTPSERFEEVKATFAQTILRRDRGAGRPTKRERREIDEFFGE